MLVVWVTEYWFYAGCCLVTEYWFYAGFCLGE